MESDTTRDRALKLVDEAFAELVDPAQRLSSVMAKAIRIARLRSDFDNLHWLVMEMHPIGDSEPRRRALVEVVNHYGPEEFEERRVRVGEAYLAQRTAAYPVDDEFGTPQVADRVMALPVPEIEVQIDLLERAVDDLSSAGDGLSTSDALPSGLLLNVAPLESVLSRIEHRVHDFLSETERQLLQGDLSADLFERNRAYVNERLSDFAPAALDQLTAAYRRAQEGDEEAWSHALTSCRRALKSLADALYPATTERITDQRGIGHALTDDKWRNRLIQFVKETISSQVAGDLLQTQLNDMASRLKALNAAGDRGVHARVTNFELNQAVIQTYLTVGDILRLHAGESGLQAASDIASSETA